MGNEGKGSQKADIVSAREPYARTPVDMAQESSEMAERTEQKKYKYKLIKERQKVNP